MSESAPDCFFKPEIRVHVPDFRISEITSAEDGRLPQIVDLDAEAHGSLGMSFLDVKNFLEEGPDFSRTNHIICVEKDQEVVASVFLQRHPNRYRSSPLERDLLDGWSLLHGIAVRSGLRREHLGSMLLRGIPEYVGNDNGPICMSVKPNNVGMKRALSMASTAFSLGAQHGYGPRYLTLLYAQNYFRNISLREFKDRTIVVHDPAIILPNELTDFARDPAWNNEEKMQGFDSKYIPIMNHRDLLEAIDGRQPSIVISSPDRQDRLRGIVDSDRAAMVQTLLSPTGDPNNDYVGTATLSNGEELFVRIDTFDSVTAEQIRSLRQEVQGMFR